MWTIGRIWGGATASNTPNRPTVSWDRMDDAAGIDVSDKGWDSQLIE
jgi:hypothetical protein